MSAPRVFDVCAELPSGTTVLEASAGTGKTFTIAALATRYVAEGLVELPQLLLVTFGRMATAELRERVRARLVDAERALRAPGSRTSTDRLVAHLAAVDDDELGRRAARLTRALAEFDAATIATTHGFCQQMLAGLGIAADVDTDAVLVPDDSELVDEVVDDVYLRRYAGTPEVPLPVQQARTVARAAVSDFQARIVPEDADPASPAGHRVGFALAVRDEVADRKRARRIVGYDDLLTLLRDALADPVSGSSAVTRLRSRYAVVLVDEFQDTDPVQWEILERAFHGARTLVLIGDPKQAIYAFRGADVVAYLDASRRAGTTATLGRSWRSDEPLIRGLDTLFNGVALGDERIVVRPVEAEHTASRLRGSAPVRLRVVPRSALGVSRSRLGAVAAARDLVYRDVATDVVRQLSGGVRLQDDHGEWRPLRPADIAVLTRRNEDAAAVRNALAAAGVPAVQSGLVSVFGTVAARAWADLLTALEQPTRPPRVAAAALTPFIGWDARRLATAGDADRDALAARLRDWSHLLADRGVAALVEAVTADGLADRLLRTTAGERTLTDLRHIGQALHRAAVEGRLGTSALVDWLRQRREEATGDYAEDRSRRLESDAAAVQVVTVHASKGLEFPVVYVPFGWDRWEPRMPDPLHLHDADGNRLLDVGGPDGPRYDERRLQHLAEERGEDLRLLYVALTRARSQLVLWWAPTNNSKAGPLSRLLLSQAPPGADVPATVTLPDDDALARRFAELSRVSDGRIDVEPVEPADPQRWLPAPTPARELVVARFRRRLDARWRRTSYSALTAAAHEQLPAAGVSSEPEDHAVVDEADVLPGGSTPDAETAPSAASGTVALQQVEPAPMSGLPGGTAFGTLVHEVLELVDPTAADLTAEVLRHCRRAAAVRGTGVDGAELAAGLVPVLRTPLGPLAGGRALVDISPVDRLTEMEFELPLAGGDGGGGGGDTGTARDGRTGTLADVAGLLRRHLAGDDPLRGYADRLDSPALRSQTLRGYLTGSLDAVLRVQDDRGVPRYLVVDYKTNRLAPADEPVTALHYRPSVLLDAMLEAHYPLQLLLYCVALHRFLRWRQPGYDPDIHLGGGLYLFVRGMVGPGTPVVEDARCGVFGWRPPSALVMDLSTLCDGRRPREAA